MFDPTLYRSNSQDLRGSKLSDDELLEHFEKFGRQEPRIFATTNSLSDRMSMRYLRGKGLEIGPGATPMRCFGGAIAEYADINQGSFYSTDLPIAYSQFRVDDKYLFKKYPDIEGKYQFVVLSHVLEHVDSMVQALSNLSRMVMENGLVYIVVPDCSKDWDGYWIDNYGLLHHAAEYFFPEIFKKAHRDKFVDGKEVVSALSDADSLTGTQYMLTELDDGSRDYAYHKHSYDYHGWLYIVQKLIKSFKIKLELIDSGTCSVRDDIHLMLRKIK